MSQLAHDANANASRNPASPWRDLAGWIVLGWVVVWSAIYFQSAVLTRFPGLLLWVGAGNV